MLRYILTVCFLLHIENFAAEEGPYILYACDKDPKQNGICTPVTEVGADVNGHSQFLNLTDGYINSSFATTSVMPHYKINIWAMVPFSKNECYPFSKSLVEPAIYQAVIDANETLCSNLTFDTLREKVLYFN